CNPFFFQAEDGIRDFHVTGVQTCALPISGLNLAVEIGFQSMAAAATNGILLVQTAITNGFIQIGVVITTAIAQWAALISLGMNRSEERRVGKEVTARWAPNEEQKEGSMQL